MYLPVDGKPFTVSMGLRALDLAYWIEIDEHFDSELAQKRLLLETNRQQVLGHLPAGDQGSLETLELLNEFLPKRFPDRFASIASDDSLHPIEQAGLLVQEDLAVLTRINGQWVLTAGNICFPSRWDLTTKLGRDISTIHEPVPHYEERIGHATRAMFDKLTVDRPVWRINWTVLDSPDLFQPTGSSRNREIDELTPENLDELLYFRTERQTLRVLPHSQDILFTIRTYVNSLGEVVEKYPEFRGNLAQTMASTSQATQGYKGWEPLMEPLLAWANDPN